MRKGDIIEGVVETLRFPNKGVFHQDETEITVKNTTNSTDNAGAEVVYPFKSFNGTC